MSEASEELAGEDFQAKEEAKRRVSELLPASALMDDVLKSEHRGWQKCYQGRQSKVVRLRKLPTQIQGHYDLPENELLENREEIIAIEVEREQCRNCHGCNVCPHEKNKNILPVVDTRGGIFSVSVESICPVERRKKAEQKQARLLRDAGVPEQYALDSWSDYKPILGRNTAAMGMAVKCVKESASLYIYGKVGRGKTKLAAIIANERIKRNLPVLFISMTSYLSALRDSFRVRDTGKVSGTNAAEIRKVMREAPFLILDDVGAELAKDWSVSDFQELVNYRYNRRLPMVVTSNYSLEDLEKHFAVRDKVQGERIADRLFEMCGEQIAELTCGNFRRSKKERGAIYAV